MKFTRLVASFITPLQLNYGYSIHRNDVNNNKKIMSTDKKVMMTFRITESERSVVQQYCELTNRNQTDVFREFVRVLAQRLSKQGISNPLL